MTVVVMWVVCHRIVLCCMGKCVVSCQRGTVHVVEQCPSESGTTLLRSALDRVLPAHVFTSPVDRG